MNNSTLTNLSPAQKAQLEEWANQRATNPPIFHGSSVPADDPVLDEVLALGNRLNNVATISAQVDTKLHNTIDSRHRFVLLIILGLIILQGFTAWNVWQLWKLAHPSA